MPFVRNAWYVAAWSSELRDAPIHQQIIGEHVLLFRVANGTAVAMEDTCPHRFAPLHKGRIIEDAIECPYHGLRFDRTGACVHNPRTGEGAPKAARRRTFSLVEKDTILWIWMGEAALADAARIPDFKWLGDGEHRARTDDVSLHQEIAFDLILDNLLDLSHAQFLHPTTLGNDAIADGNSDTCQEGDTIHSTMFNPNGAMPALFRSAGMLDPDTRVDYWGDIRWDPVGSYSLSVGVMPTGCPREDGFFYASAQLLTPVDATTTIYRYTLVRDFALDDNELTAAMAAIVHKAFTEEDEPMLRAVQERMAGQDFWSLQPLLLRGDKAGVLARRTLDRLCAAEDLRPEVHGSIILPRRGEPTTEAREETDHAT